MPGLTQPERDALAADDFAIPAKRKLPIHDAKHAQMAFGALGQIAGITDKERSEVRQRILSRAETLGLDTSDWATRIRAQALKALPIDAAALNISNSDHPNKMPFSGIMTRVGVPSDYPPGGSGGKLVMLTPEAAEKALPSLLGMAVDYTPSFDGHDTQAKIGLITSAKIEGDAIVIEGFVYAADFPEQAARIRQDKDILGFSFEAQEIYVRDPGADPLEIVECIFTGAAILRKDKAAYSSTSLAASADSKDIEMNKEELAALLGETLAAAMKPMNDRLGALEAESKATSEATKKHLEMIEANKAVMDKVEPHAAGLEAAADKMMADGIGAAADGHGAMLKRMASSMRASAAMGKMPSNFYASAETKVEVEAKPDPKVAELETKLAALEAGSAAATAKAIEDATKDLKAEVATLKTKSADLDAGARRESPSPERKTIAPAVAALLSKAGINAGAEGDEKLKSADVDAAFAKAGITDFAQRVAVKRSLEVAGRL